MWYLTLVLTAHAGTPIDFDTAIRTAVDSAPGSDLVEAQRQLARGQALSLPAASNPSLEAEQLVNETEIRASVPIPISGAPLVRLHAAGAVRRAADARFDAGRADLAYDAGFAYLEAVAADERAELAAHSRADAERVRDAATRLNEAGELSDVDRAVTEAIAAEALATAATAQRDAAVARLRLEILLGQQPTGDLDPVGWPTLGVPAQVDPSSLPTVVAVAEDARAARSLRTAAWLDRVPTPEVIAGRQLIEGGQDGTIYGVGLQVPLFSPGIGSVRAAGAEARIAEAQAEIALLDAEASIAAARLEVEAAERAWQATAAVPGLHESLTHIGEALELGEFSVLDYAARRQSILSALQTRITARQRLESARLDLWRLAGEIPTEIPSP
jgi:outer membrane protein TolC